jgi:hypothetical protein
MLPEKTRLNSMKISNRAEETIVKQEQFESMLIITYKGLHRNNLNKKSYVVIDRGLIYPMTNKQEAKRFIIAEQLRGR